MRSAGKLYSPLIICAESQLNSHGWLSPRCVQMVAKKKCQKVFGQVFPKNVSMGSVCDVVLLFLLSFNTSVFLSVGLFM